MHPRLRLGSGCAANADDWSSVRNPPTADNRLLSTGFHQHPREAMTNSVCNSGQDSRGPPGPATDLRTGTRILKPVVSSCTSPDPRRSSPSRNSYCVAQNVRAGAAGASVVAFRSLAASNDGRGLGRLPPFGHGVDPGSPPARTDPDRLEREGDDHGSSPASGWLQFGNARTVGVRPQRLAGRAPSERLPVTSW